MIDNHWVVSITDWGLNKFKAGQERIYTDTNKTNEGMYVIDYRPWIGQGASGCGSMMGYEPFRYKFIQSRCKQFHVLGLKNEEYSPKMLLLFTRKLYLK